MRTKSTGGFTLIELLIVIAIIGILAAVLIPNLLNARQRAFDTAAQTCLRELSTQLEVTASNAPFTYAGHTLASVGSGTSAAPFGVTVGPTGSATRINSCERVETLITMGTGDADFVIQGLHEAGTTEYVVRNGTGVVPRASDPGGVAVLPAAL